MKPIQDRSLLNTNFTNQEKALATSHNDRNMTTLVLSLKNDTNTQKSNLVIKGNFSLPEQKITRSIVAGGKVFSPRYDINGSSVVHSVELPILINKLPPAEPFEVQMGNSLERIHKITGPFQEIITGLFTVAGVIGGVVYNEKIRKHAHDTKAKCSNAGGHVKSKSKQAAKLVKDRFKPKPHSDKVS